MYEEISANKRNSYILFSLLVALLIFIGYIVGYIWIGNGIAGIAIASVIAFIYILISYYTGDKVILAMSGAKEATKKEFAHYVNTVEGLAIASGIPQPKAYVINDPSINAFATGRDPQHAAITVTTGALSKLNREELEGVVAHEMGHIKNYDIRFMMLVVVIIGLITIISHIFLRSFLFGGHGGGDNKGNITIIFVLVGLILAIFAPIIGYLIRMAISRKREYLADATGALLTRYPKGLANALKKIKAEHMPMKKVDKSMASLFIANPLKSSWLNNIFSTHPPVDQRIKRLEAM